MEAKDGVRLLADIPLILDPLAGLDQRTARDLHLLAALVVKDRFDHGDVQLAGAPALLLGDADDALLRREHVAGHDRGEIFELLLAMHDIAPVLHLERLSRGTWLVQEGAQEGRRRRNAAGWRRGRMDGIAIDRILVADGVGKFLDLSTLHPELVRRKRFSRSPQIHAVLIRLSGEDRRPASP